MQKDKGITLEAIWNFSAKDNCLNLHAYEIKNVKEPEAEIAQTPEEITQGIEKLCSTEELTPERTPAEGLNMRYISCQGETFYLSLKFKEAVTQEKGKTLIQKLREKYPTFLLTRDFYEMDKDGIWQPELKNLH